MSIRNLILVVVVVGALVVFALENATPVVPLVILGSETVALPLWVWLMGAIAAGALTTLIIAGLIQVAGTPPRPPQGQYYSDRPRYRPPSDDSILDDDEDWQVVDVEEDREGDRPSDSRSGTSPTDSSNQRSQNTGFFNQNNESLDNSSGTTGTSSFSNFTATATRPSPLEDWDRFSQKRMDWDDWNRYEEAAPAAARSTSTRQEKGTGVSNAVDEPNPRSYRDRSSAASARTAFTAPETVIQDADDRDWDDWRGYEDNWQPNRDDSRTGQSYGDRQDDGDRPSSSADVRDDDIRDEDFRDEDFRDDYVRDRDFRDDDVRDDYQRNDRYDIPYEAEPQELYRVRYEESREGDRYEDAYGEESYQERDAYDVDDGSEYDSAESYQTESYQTEPYRDIEYGTGVDVPVEDEEYDDGDAAPGYGYDEGYAVAGEGDRPDDLPVEETGYYTDYVRYSEEDDYYDDYDDYATANQDRRTTRDKATHNGDDVGGNVNDEAIWDDWEEESESATSSSRVTDTEEDNSPPSKRGIYEVQQQPIAVNRTGSIYSYSYRKEDAEAGDDTSNSAAEPGDTAQSGSSEKVNTADSDSDDPARILTTPPPKDLEDHSP